MNVMNVIKHLYKIGSGGLLDLPSPCSIPLNLLATHPIYLPLSHPLLFPIYVLNPPLQLSLGYLMFLNLLDRFLLFIVGLPCFVLVVESASSVLNWADFLHEGWRVVEVL